MGGCSPERVSMLLTDRIDDSSVDDPHFCHQCADDLVQYSCLVSAAPQR